MSWPDPTSVAVRTYLVQFRNYYPGILEWYSRIEAELATGRRRLFSAWSGDKVTALAITKNGPSAKLCHISVAPSARDCGLGRTLMHRALQDMTLHGACTIRVTTSEEVLRNHGTFFRAVGFEAIDWRVHRYRPGMSEILWQMDASLSADIGAPVVAEGDFATEIATLFNSRCAYCSELRGGGDERGIGEVEHFVPKGTPNDGRHAALALEFANLITCCPRARRREHASSPTGRLPNTAASLDAWSQIRHRFNVEGERASVIDEPRCSKLSRHPR